MRTRREGVKKSQNFADVIYGLPLDRGGDEADGQDEFIFPVDYSSGGIILDDELKALLSDNLPEGVRYNTHTFLDI